MNADEPESGLADEARAFDRRIEDRLHAGFVPDLRRAVKCEYFYTSFWRDPHFVRLYLGRTIEVFPEAQQFCVRRPQSRLVAA